MQWTGMSSVAPVHVTHKRFEIGRIVYCKEDKKQSNIFRHTSHYVQVRVLENHVTMVAGCIKITQDRVARQDHGTNTDRKVWMVQQVYYGSPIRHGRSINLHQKGLLFNGSRGKYLRRCNSDKSLTVPTTMLHTVGAVGMASGYPRSVPNCEHLCAEYAGFLYTFKPMSSYGCVHVHVQHGNAHQYNVLSYSCTCVCSRGQEGPDASNQRAKYLHVFPGQSGHLYKIREKGISSPRQRSNCQLRMVVFWSTEDGLQSKSRGL